MELSAALGDGSSHEDVFWRRVRRVHLVGPSAGISETIRLAGSRGVLFGVHLAAPGEDESLRASVLAQIDALRRFTPVSHLRLTDKFYEAAQHDPDVERQIVELIMESDPAMSIVAPSHASLAAFARARGINVIREARADRRYGPDGLPQEPDVPGSLLNWAEAVMQATLLVRYGVVILANGVLLPMEADTLCVQTSDESAVERLQAIETAVALADRIL